MIRLSESLFDSFTPAAGHLRIGPELPFLLARHWDRIDMLQLQPSLIHPPWSVRRPEQRRSNLDLLLPLRRLETSTRFLDRLGGT